MNQGDRAWHYSLGPKGAVRRVAMVVGLHDSADMERVNLFVYPLSASSYAEFSSSQAMFDAVPVRYHYKEGSPVDAPFCTPVEPNYRQLDKLNKNKNAVPLLNPIVSSSFGPVAKPSATR